MRKKIIEVFVCLLIIAILVLPVSGIIENGEHNYFNEIERFNCPDDFELVAFSVSIDTWEYNYKLEINNEGLSRYYCMYPKNRENVEWTLVNEFTLSSSDMDEIWAEILDNDFFNLDDLYESPISVFGGSYAKLIITGNDQTHAVKTVNIVVPKFDRIVMKINTIIPEDSNLIYTALVNYEFNSAPFKPDKPLGETNGKAGVEYEYFTSCIDPEFNKVWYLFDWGDGNFSGWFGPFNSGDEVSATHTWRVKKTYNVKVSAKDECGAESVWSDPLAVSMPKVKQKDNSFFLRILEWFYSNGFQTGIHSLKSFFPNYLLDEKPADKSDQNLDNQPPWIIEPFEYGAVATFKEGNFTNVKIDGCNITVSIYIEIFGSGTAEQGGTVNASFVKSSIENFWNKRNQSGENQEWYIQCKEIDRECDPTEPGCKVSFVAIVKNTKENETLDGGGTWSETGNFRKKRDADGYHQIRIINNSTHRSFVNIWGPPYNATNPPPNNGTDPYLGNDNFVGGIWSSSAAPKVIAHEAGHLMGLGDQYKDVGGVSVPNTGCETNIMASVSKCNETANRSQIEEIVNNGNVYCPCKCCPVENDTEEPVVNIDYPLNGSSTTGPIKVGGTATDTGGSGVSELVYRLEWDDAFYDGESIFFNPPKQGVSFELGPIDIDYFIDVGDWIKIIIYAIDHIGNIGSDEVTVKLVEEEDTTPPVTVKIIGQPQGEGGYIIWPHTPITFTAVDSESGVNYIYYEVWWDSNGDESVDTKMGSEKVYEDSLTFSVNMWGVLIGVIELRWFAVDNAGNTENMHYQEHYVNP